MTLTTTIGAALPVPGWLVFRATLKLLGAELADFDESYRLTGDGGRCTLATVPGQALPADVHVMHNNGRPVTTWRTPSPSEIYAAVTFSTAYSYNLPFGVTPADFHAWLVRETKTWLNAQGVPAMWTSTEVQTWHTGDLHLLGNPEAVEVTSC